MRKDGKFVAEDGSVPAGNDAVNNLLTRCLNWAEQSLERYIQSRPILNLL